MSIGPVLHLLGIASTLVLAACAGSPATPSPRPDESPDPSAPSSTETFYVATNEPGASNDACDGRSPVDAGGGRCPFKDFLSPHTFRLLRDRRGVTVLVRAGHYDLSQTDGLELRGTGVVRLGSRGPVRLQRRIGRAGWSRRDAGGHPDQRCLHAGGRNHGPERRSTQHLDSRWTRPHRARLDHRPEPEQ